MASYLLYMDMLKDNYLKTISQQDNVSYTYAQFHYYQDIKYVTPEEITFHQSLCAVKLSNTAIVFVDQQKATKVYFTDKDIKVIVSQLSNESLKNHIYAFLQKAINGKGLSTLTFALESKTFKIKGIPFDSAFNNVVCKNPADIDINGNDLVGLINLILEKERTDKRKDKLANTARFYMS